MKENRFPVIEHLYYDRQNKNYILCAQIDIKDYQDKSTYEKVDFNQLSSHPTVQTLALLSAKQQNLI